MEKRRLERVTILLTPKEKKEVEKKAQKQKMPVSAFLRALALGDDEKSNEKSN